MLANAVASAAAGLVVSFQSYVHLHGYNVTRKQAFVNDLIEQSYSPIVDKKSLTSAFGRAARRLHLSRKSYSLIRDDGRGDGKRGPHPFVVNDYLARIIDGPTTLNGHKASVFVRVVSDCLPLVHRSPSRRVVGVHFSI